MDAPTVYVVMIGSLPQAVASTLEAAQASAFEAEERYIGEGDEVRWDEYRLGKEWRFMKRPKGRRRFAWSVRWIAAAPFTDEAVPE